MGKKKDAAEPAQAEVFVNNTPKGEKKDVNEPLAAAYNPIAVESAWDDWWQASGYYKADNTSDKPPYVIMLPPPNVTGALHLGHALTVAIEDTIVRWRRMQGHNVLWLPGQDHAGISTQVVVEKRLAREQGISRHDLGREPFIQEVWKWKEEYGSRISSQLGKLGASLDYSREAFTMDDNLNVAVRTAFVRMYDSKKIYRAERLVNWDSQLKSAVSDIEVDHITLEKPTRMRVPGHGDKTYEFGTLIEFAYKVEGSDDEVVIATTRLETMLGDTAVAVHPEDPRYTHLHGKFLVHPFVERRIPIILDAELVDMEFGTGAVKVTPAHDPNDFKTGKRHELPFITILNDDGTMNDKCAQFSGMRRFDARLAVLQALKDMDLYRDTKPNPGMRVPISQRTKDIIEPMLKPQWWVDCSEMAARGVKAVREGELKIVPAQYKDTWFNWLENIRDWCISRQLWWGHRIPAWYAVFEGEAEEIPLQEDSSRWVVSMSEESATIAAQEKFPGQSFKLIRDEDVLDTWFSSGLFPFSTLGWPDESAADFTKFYPNHLLETGHDILFFWVARMVMMGLELTDKLPFDTVYLHAMVRDSHGRKMSKSLGNVIDPMDVIEGISLKALHERLEQGNLDPREVEKAKKGQSKDFPKGIPQCGSDALRFALCSYSVPGLRDINLDVLRIEGYRHFCNKLWNATKYAIGNLGEGYQAPEQRPSIDSMQIADKWIISRMNAAVTKANDSLTNWDFTNATSAMHSFFIYELCDVYLEWSKGVFTGGDDAKIAVSRAVLWECLDTSLKLMHPVMPFVTEELWQRLPKRGSAQPSIMLEAYPAANPDLVLTEAEEHMKVILDSARVARQMKDSLGLKPKSRPDTFIAPKSDIFRSVLPLVLDDISLLGNVGAVKVQEDGSQPDGCGMRPIGDQAECFLLIKGLVDVEAEVKTLNKKVAAHEKKIEGMHKQMSIPNYETKVPENVRQANTEKLATLTEEKDAMLRSIQQFEALR